MANLHYAEKFELPILYGIDKAGKERFWKVYTEDNVLHSHQGLVSGKAIPHERTFQGKNIGKNNETTPTEQAKQAAEKKWVKQLTKNYAPKCKEGKAMLEKVQAVSKETGGHNINASTAIRGRKEKVVKEKGTLIAKNIDVKITPMKANVFEMKDGKVLPKVLKYFNFEEGVFVQAKLDGWRCVARLQNGGKVVLTSNSGKEYPWFKTLREDIKKFLKGKDCLDGLDGEIYSHALIDENGNDLEGEAKFSMISSICGLSRSEPHILEDKVELHVFDLVDLSGKLDQTARFKKLETLFDNAPDNLRVVKCDGKLIFSLKEVFDYHDEVAQKLYEGVILRPKTMPYIQNRSMQMRKYKNFSDSEFRIVGSEKDPGLDDETFVWICEHPQTREKFRVKPGGSVDMRRNQYRHTPEYVGKSLTVKYQNLSPTGIPRFGVGKGIREDIFSG